MHKESERSGDMKLLQVLGFIGFIICKHVEGFDNASMTVTDMHYVKKTGFYRGPLFVGLTLINGAAAKGAGISSCIRPVLSASFLCLDGICFKSSTLFWSTACNFP